mmetsp:Transcript_56463/g.89937  ORF Transcript_56463/g.89937 Transcript_56463/m.89937 type:complete len:288 (-) Transcript_56463:212-1075(-)
MVHARSIANLSIHIVHISDIKRREQRNQSIQELHVQVTDAKRKHIQVVQLSLLMTRSRQHRHILMLQRPSYQQLRRRHIILLRNPLNMLIPGCAHLMRPIIEYTVRLHQHLMRVCAKLLSLASIIPVHPFEYIGHPRRLLTLRKRIKLVLHKRWFHRRELQQLLNIARSKVAHSQILDLARFIQLFQLQPRFFQSPLISDGTVQHIHVHVSHAQVIQRGIKRIRGNTCAVMMIMRQFRRNHDFVALQAALSDRLSNRFLVVVILRRIDESIASLERLQHRVLALISR